MTLQSGLIGRLASNNAYDMIKIVYDLDIIRLRDLSRAQFAYRLSEGIRAETIARKLAEIIMDIDPIHGRDCLI